MVATFVGLKFRLLRNGFRRSAARAAVAAFAFFGLMGLVMLGGAMVVLRSEPEFVGPWFTVMLAALVVVWLVVPLLIGMTDGAIDPSRLAHLPVGGARLITGLTAAAAIGIVPAFFLTGLLLLSIVARSPAELLFSVVAAGVVMTMCIITAQVGASVMAGLLRGRKSRDIAAVILALLAMSTGLFMQFGLDAITGATLEQVQSVARWARWTPGGWIGNAIGASRDGRWIAAFGGLVAGAGYAVTCAALWWRLLERLLTTSEESVGASTSASAFIPALLQRLPMGDPLKASIARALRSIRRDPREWSGIASQLPVLLIVGFPVAQIDSERAVLFAGAAGIYGGMLNSNIFGIDGRALWVDQMAAVGMRPVIWGKTIAHALIVVPMLVAMVVGLAIWKDGWEYAIQGAALACATFGTITGAVSVASVRYGVPLPDGMNPFAGQGTGQTASQGFLLMGSLIAGFVLSMPVVGAVVFASIVNPILGIVLSPLALAYGVLMWRIGVHRAATEAEERAPEFLERFTVRA